LRSSIVAVLFLMSPTLAWGATVGIRTQSALEYDSNVARTSRGSEGDLIFRTIQRISFTDRGDGYGYSLRYALPYSVSMRTDVINNVDHHGGGTFDFKLGPKTNLAANSAFSISHGTSPITNETALEDGTSVLQVVNRGEQITNFNANLSLNHAFTSRMNGNFNFAYRLYDSTQRNRREVNSIAGATGLNYAVNSKSRVGLGVNFSYQDFADLPGQPGSTTLTTRVFASWVYRFDDSLSFSIRAGPTLISTHQRGADPVVEFPSSFVFNELEKDTVFPAGSLTFEDAGGLFRNGDALNIPAGSLLINPVEACPDAELPPPNENDRQLPCGAQSVIVNNGDPLNTAGIDAVKGSGSTELIFVDRDGDGFPDTPGSASDQTLTIFGSANLTKRWSPLVHSGIGYRRTQSDASGLAGSAILDAVNAFVRWRISPRLNATLRADWTQRQSVAPNLQTTLLVNGSTDAALLAVPLLPTVAEIADTAGGNRVFREVSNRVDTQRWGVASWIERTVTPNLDANLRVSFNRQSSRSGSAGSTTDFNEFSVIFGFTYTFDPIEVW
jgi:hypothetical protein